MRQPDGAPVAGEPVKGAAVDGHSANGVEERAPAASTLGQATARALAGGPQRHREKAVAQGKLPVRERVARLLDDGSFAEEALLANWLQDGLGADGVLTGLGRIGGRPVAVMANDPTVKAGSWGPKTVEKILRIQERALSLGVPLVYLVDSAGARITDQVQMFPGRRGAGRIFYNQVKLSGVVPQVCVLFGPSAAGGAYIPAFCDVVIMRDGNASMYLGSPRMAQMVIGENVTLEQMGGARMHTGVSGCGHVLVENDEEGIDAAVRFLSYLPTDWRSDPPGQDGVPDGGRAGGDLSFSALIARARVRGRDSLRKNDYNNDLSGTAGPGGEPGVAGAAAGRGGEPAGAAAGRGGEPAGAAAGRGGEPGAVETEKVGAELPVARARAAEGVSSGSAEGVAGGSGVAAANRPSIAELIPADENKPFDIKLLLDALLDADSFFEIHARWAKELVVGFGHLGGRAVGIVANQPKVKGGVLFCDSADKAARFIWMCNAFNVPLLFLADVPGFMIGTAVERAGIIRHGAKMISAVSEATVPKISVIVRKAYGAGLYAMAGPAFEPDCCLALPTASIAVMGPQAAINAVYYNQLAAIEDEDARAAETERLRAEYAADIDILHLASELVIDAIVEPDALRDELIARFALAARTSREWPAKRNPVTPV